MQEQQEPADEQGEIKKRALRRLGVALVLIAAAVAGLALLERWNAPKKVTVPPQAELPPPAAPVPAESAPEPQPEAPEPPPPPAVVNNERLVAPPAQQRPAPQPATVAAPPKVAAQPVPPPPAAPAPKGYVVQLGVFSSTANAEALRARLLQNGIQSHTETRVHVGPFKDRAEAEKTLEKLRALGINAVVMPAR